MYFVVKDILVKLRKGGGLPNVKLPNYQVIKSTRHIWYIDFEKEKVVRGDPYQHGVTKLPSYFVYHTKNCMGYLSRNLERGDPYKTGITKLPSYFVYL